MQTPQQLRALLVALGDEVRAHLHAARGGGETWSTVARQDAADTIYEVDRVTEEALAAWLEAHWPAAEPVEVVMEGVDPDAPLILPTGTPRDATAWKLLIDPVDGTRPLMYDKRSAWFLASVAPQRGTATTLADTLAAVMTELPTTRQAVADTVSGVRGERPLATRQDLRSGAETTIPLRPSTACDLRHGFASLFNPFPPGMGLIGQLNEELINALYPDFPFSEAPVFVDQYCSTGGQFHELLSGRERFLADLRPLVFRQLRYPDPLACHPYDCAAVLLLEGAGVIIEDPWGEPLRSPLDTTTPVAWVAYANETLAAHVRPALHRVLDQHRLR